jgi:predicted nucleic acid-binding protein
MSVLVDTSVWIEYFRRGHHSENLEFLIDQNLIVINDLILAELIPALTVRRRRDIVKLLSTIRKLVLSIQWNQIIEFQVKCLEKGLNGIGVPDLIIAQNAKQNECAIYSLDHHFKMIKGLLELQLME